MNYVFVTGMGRSGTRFLAEILNHAPRCAARHEFIGDREFWLLSWYLGQQEYTVPYLRGVRRRIEQECTGKAVFVDVNSYLQNAVPALREVFDDSPVVHLVRDPRQVIPSIYKRRSDRDVDRIPKTGDLTRWWLEADKFERICWNWAETTRRLMAEGTITVRFEDISNRYDRFSDGLTKAVGVDIPRKTWEAMRARRVNATRSSLYRYVYARLKGRTYVSGIPSYAGWSQRLKDVYQRTCGDLAAELGYV